ncbi:MAG TPA: hypothetical protein VFS42_05390 [Burkholderiaceae bacterium]|nr:hypothetical protein [Burkholderiaceae bacterium]
MTAEIAALEAEHETVSTPDFSVLRHVRSMPKYIVEIHRSDAEDAIDPVPVQNGDYFTVIRRGRRVVVPEAVVTVLNDARGQRLNSDTKKWESYVSYPYSAVPYNGDLPIGTEVDEFGQPVTKD